MEDLRLAAVAYYNNGTKDLRKQARNFFNSMDRNGDKYVSRAEFLKFLQENGYGNSTHFDDLDRNHKGRLDFNAVLAFYYIIKTRYLRCKRCQAWLTRLYFTCVECFNGAPDTYDLCSRCYSAKGPYKHNHSRFLDNRMLLGSQRGQATGLPNLNLCKRCKAWLTGLYFTCVECFNGAPDTYDLCSRCYSFKGHYNHNHSRFLDNHMLLRSQRGQATGLPNLNLVITPKHRGRTTHARVNTSAEHAEHAMVIAPTHPTNGKILRQAFLALEAATAAANLITMFTCTIL